MKRACIGILTVLCLVLGWQTARADYPEKAITCVVPFAPGGAADISVRMLADELGKELGQPLAIVNKGGGSGIPGLNFGLKAANDGYTVSGGAIGNALVATSFLNAPEYNLDDMVFVGAYMPQDRILLSRPDKPWKTWQEFMDYAKKHPDSVSVGSGASQEGLEVVRSAGIKDGAKMKYVMYKSGGPATADLLGGHIDAAELGVGTAGYQAARKGDLLVLANLGTAEVPDFPDVPKLRDLGYPFSTSLMYGFVFPKGTPENVRAKWEQALQKVLANPEVLAKMEAAGFVPHFLTGKEYEEFSRDSVQSVKKMLEYNKQDAGK